MRTVKLEIAIPDEVEEITSLAGIEFVIDSPEEVPIDTLAPLLLAAAENVLYQMYLENAETFDPAGNLEFHQVVAAHQARLRLIDEAVHIPMGGPRQFGQMEIPG